LGKQTVDSDPNQGVVGYSLSPAATGPVQSSRHVGEGVCLVEPDASLFAFQLQIARPWFGVGWLANLSRPRRLNYPAHRTISRDRGVDGLRDELNIIRGAHGRK